ncbi:MAG: hypothetical protein H6679_01720 [Epsilonproteobacteria bacterium]|nr:hypothetical protein [Campylobacterota bacterium]
MKNVISKALLLSIALTVSAGQQVQAMNHGNPEQEQNQEKWYKKLGKGLSKHIASTVIMFAGASLLSRAKDIHDEYYYDLQNASKYTENAIASLEKRHKLIHKIRTTQVLAQTFYPTKNFAEIDATQDLTFTLDNAIRKTQLSEYYLHRAPENLVTGALFLAIGGMAAYYFYLRNQRTESE